MWQPKTLTLNQDWLDTTFNSELKASINAVVLPGNVATIGDNQPGAISDSTRDLSPLINKIETILITPWHHGGFNGSKQTQDFWLSPGDAQNQLSKQLEFIAWESCIIFMALADNAQNLLSKLEGLAAVFSCDAIAKATRQAQSLVEHEKKKLFVPGIKNDDRAARTIESGTGLNTLAPAKQNQAFSQAFASDTDPTTILTQFKSTRAERLEQVKSDITNLSNQNGAIDHVLYLTGGDLSQQIKDTVAPSNSAPLCVMFSMGGTASQLAPLVEVLAL
jgi:hypothetical protein